MQPALDSNTLGRLVSLGRERGCLTTEDLRASLPVESMSAEEIALVVVQLEETGVPVALEESLLSPHPRPVPQPRRSAEIIPFPGPRADRGGMAKSMPTASGSHQTEAQEISFARWVIAAAGALVFGMFALILLASVG